MLPGFRYPLTPAALAEFCHPDELSPFHHPFRHDGAVFAANGFLVLRCHRGHWLESDFHAAPPEAVQRLASFDWSKVAAIPPDRWFPLDSIETEIRQRFGTLSPWLGTRCNASPVWKLGAVPVRVSFLHLAARLPRAECAWEENAGPLWLRFSGGMGAIARDKRLDRWSREVWPTRTDKLTGARIKPSPAQTPSIRFPSPTMADWPPPEPLD